MMKKTAWNKGLPKEKQPFYGKKHTKKHKEKMSKLKNNLGIKLTKSWKEKISKSLIVNERAKGKYFSASRIIREFQITCQCIRKCPWHKNKCNFPYKEALELDHIKPRKKFPELKKEISNLQMLCANCHKLKSKYEKKNS